MRYTSSVIRLLSTALDFPLSLISDRLQSYKKKKDDIVIYRAEAAIARAVTWMRIHRTIYIRHFLLKCDTSYKAQSQVATAADINKALQKRWRGHIKTTVASRGIYVVFVHPTSDDHAHLSPFPFSATYLSHPSELLQPHQSPSCATTCLRKYQSVSLNPSWSHHHRPSHPSVFLSNSRTVQPKRPLSHLLHLQPTPQRPTAPHLCDTTLPQRRPRRTPDTRPPR